MEYQIKGGVAQIDPEDLPLISKYKWHVGVMKCGIKYAQVCIYTGLKDGKKTNTTIRMHRLLCGLKKGDKRVVDHGNRDGLDNRRSNMRVTTHGKNNANKVLVRAGAYPVGARWMSRISSEGKGTYLGCFASQAEAQEAFKVAARQLHGEFTRV